MLKRFLLLLGITFLLVGCDHIFGPRGFIQDSSSNYVESKSVPRLNIPPGYSRSKIEEYYVVPNTNTRLTSTYVPIKPPGSLAAKTHQQNIRPDRPMSLVQTDPTGLAQLGWDEPLNEAWNEVGDILPDLNYTVTRKNKELRIYYFVIPRFLKRKGDLYQLHLKPLNANQTVLWITDIFGKPIPPRRANRILHKINKEHIENKTGAPLVEY